MVAPSRRRHTGIHAARLSEPQQLLELVWIKTHHRLAVDDRHRSGPEPKLDELLEGGLVRPDVLDSERYTVLRKKLFLSVACASAGLGIDHHLLCHPGPPSVG